ncbi:PREDICTED: cornulin-like [Chaetura pelagica]|uniref:cornulin-like n=1 Tax=Chaetura pelagica TaxID=8897 RepID=UPI0005239B27|nr:PREDICTED: cornulin-like [Chaetura pelagica]
MSQPQENMDGIISAFYMCTRSDGKCSPLSLEELRYLMEQEFAEAMQNPQDPKTVKKVLCFLDDNSNCRVDFRELLSLVFRVAKACYQPLQQHQRPEDQQELIKQEKAVGEQPLGLQAEGRVFHNEQVHEQDVSNQVQDPVDHQIQEAETPKQDQDNHQTQEAETSKQDRDTHQTQEGETSKQDQDTRQSQEGETSKQDQDTRQTQEGETPKQDPDNHQTQEGETKEEDQDTHQTQEGETKEEDQDTHQTQEGETKEEDQDTHQTQEGEKPEQEQDTHQDDGTEAPGGDPERGEILDTATPEQDRNTHKAEVTETPKQDPKLHLTKEIDAPRQGSNDYQSPEMESEEQDLNCLSETQERYPNKDTQVCEVPWHDPNPSKAQKLLAPQLGASPRWDPKLQGSLHDPTIHHLPEPKVLEQEHGYCNHALSPALSKHLGYHDVVYRT